MDNLERREFDNYLMAIEHQYHGETRKDISPEYIKQLYQWDHIEEIYEQLHSK